MKIPQFTLRDLFWLVLVVALACAWWMQEGRIAEARREKSDAEEKEKLLERIRADQQTVIDAYARDGRLHHVRRPDGSVFVTDEKPPMGGFGPADQ